MLLTLGLLGFGMCSFRYGAHQATALALIALGVGFLVCAKAHGMECCRKLGKVIGVVIMIISALVLICLATLCILRVSGKGGDCNMMKRMGGMGMGMGMGGRGGMMMHPPIEIPVEIPVEEETEQ